MNTTSMTKNCKLAILLVSGTLATVAQAQVHISQVYGGGGNAGAPYNRDYVELFNSSASPVVMTGWSIQYAATAGTTWTNKALPAGATIQPYSYYLIQMTTTGTTGAALPTPDFTVPTATSMATDSGKLALMRVATTITSGTSCPVGNANLEDFVGYGTANCFEGVGAAPVISNTTADFRVSGGCFDNDQNNSNFVVGAPAPRNSATASNVCSSGSFADLGVAFTTQAACPVNVGGTTTVSLTVTNYGSVASDGTVAFTFPDNVSFVSSVPAAVPSGHTVSTTFAGIAPGASAVFSIDVQGAGSGTGLGSATVSSSVTDPGVGNDSAIGAPIFVVPTTSSVKGVMTSIGSNANSIVPPGNSSPANFFFSTAQTEVFGRPFESPDHSRIIFRGLSNLPTTQDQILVAFPTANPSAGATLVQENVTDLGGGELVFALDQFPSINNAGNYAYSADTTAATTADEVVVKVVSGTPSVIAREGSSTLFGSPIGTTSTSYNIDSNDKVFFWHQGPTLTINDAFVLKDDGLTPVAREGFDIPVNQVGGTTFSLGNFDTGTDLGNFQELSSDGAHSMINGVLEAGTTDPEIIVIDNTVVLEDGGTIPGVSGLITTFSAIDLVNGGGGSWIGYGSNDDGSDWVVRNGVLLAKDGDPIIPGSTEHFGSSTFSGTFYIAAANSAGDYVIGGITDNADLNNNAIVVLNGTTVLLRENDPIDADGDGLFNDDTYVRTFRDDRVLLTNDALWAVVELRSAASYCSGNTKTGDALIRIPLPASHCPADLDNGTGTGVSDGGVDVNDLLFFLVKFEAGDAAADLDNGTNTGTHDGGVDINDLLYFLTHFEAGC